VCGGAGAFGGGLGVDDVRVLAFAGVVLAKPHWHNKGLMACLVVVRAVLMNCSSPLQAALLTDHVPTESRANGQPRQPEHGRLVRKRALGGYLCDSVRITAWTFVMTMGAIGRSLGPGPRVAPGTVNTQVLEKRVQVWEIMQTFPVTMYNMC